MREASERPVPPFYRLPPQPVSYWTMLRRSVSDPPSTIPATVYDKWALKLPGPMSPVVVSHPDEVRRILLDKTETFGRNRQLRLLMRRAWGRGLAAAEGEDWARQRRAATPAFRPEAVANVAPLMAGIACRSVSGWPDGQVELGGAMGRIVAEIVATALLGGASGSDCDALARESPAIIRKLSTFGPLDLVPLPDVLLDRWRGIGGSVGERAVREIADRIAARSNPSGSVPTLMDGTGPLADNVFGFLLAGFETTALAAAWSAWLLAFDPDWQDAVRAEARGSPADATAEARPLARQVVQEAMRLYPPAPLLVRAALRRTVVAGITLWPGQTVIVPVFAIHRHRKLWDAPDAFDPARFAVGASYERAAYLPFGAGPRMCVAATFALAEATIIVSELTRTRQLALAGPPPDISLNVATRSLNGLNVLLKRAA